ncbi:MAG: OmpA family protein [bacterium]|nr:OmpA family protein [bacterium]
MKSGSKRIIYSISVMAWCLQLLTSAACVSATRYEEAVASRDALREDVADCTAEAADLEQRLIAAVSEAARRQNRRVDSEEEFRKTVTEKDQTISELERYRTATEKSLEVYRGLLRDLRGLTDAGALEVVLRRGRMIIVLPSDVLFDSGSAAISDDGRKTLGEVARVLAGVDRRFQVEGHTDSKPIRGGRYKSNWELGAARAIHVAGLIIDGGVPETRISAATFGETRPVASNDDSTGRRANRRIEIVVVPELNVIEELLEATQDAKQKPQDRE